MRLEGSLQVTGMWRVMQEFWGYQQHSKVRHSFSFVCHIHQLAVARNQPSPNTYHVSESRPAVLAPRISQNPLVMTRGLNAWAAEKAFGFKMTRMHASTTLVRQSEMNSHLDTGSRSRTTTEKNFCKIFRLPYAPLSQTPHPCSKHPSCAPHFPNCQTI